MIYNLNRIAKFKTCEKLIQFQKQKSGRNILAANLFHLATNFAQEMLADSPQLFANLFDTIDVEI